MSSESSQKEGYKIHRLKDLINRNLIRFDKSAQNNAEESDSLKPQPLTVRLALYFSDLMSVINDFGVSGPKAYLDITGINDEIAFTTRRQGLVGAIEIQGQYQMAQQEQFSDMIDTLERRWQTLMSHRGIALDFVFMGGEKQLVRKQLNDAIAPNVATSRRFKLGLENVLESKVDALVQHCAFEKAYLCVWVEPSVLSGAERKTVDKAQKKANGAAAFTAPHSIDLSIASRQIESIHLTTLQQIANDLEAVGVVSNIVTCRHLLRDIRLMTEPDNTSYTWEPSLPGAHRPTRKIHANSTDVSHLFPPSFDRQLFPNGVGEHIDNSRVISYGGKLHSGVIVTRPCLSPTNFQELFAGLKLSNIPYRIRILLNSDGLSSTSLAVKSTLANLFSWADSTGTSNRAINSSLQFLREYRENDGAIVGLSIVADTWVTLTSSDDQFLKEHQEQLAINVEKLTKVIQSWGGMDTKHISGDPLYTSMSTLPAVSRTTPGEIACAPLRDALVLLPLFRPAAYWQTGGMLLRSVDGKIIPYEPVSSKQKAWGEIIIAPQRFGKSFWQQARNMALWTAKGITQLPYIMTLDIGPSSAGFVNLVEYSLPVDQQHLAMHVRLNNTTKYAINPFDTQLGVRFPTASKEGFLVNLMCLLLADDELHVQEGMAGLALKAIREAYRRTDDPQTPKRYQLNQAAEIDQWIKESGFSHVGNQSLTWWNLVDELFARDLFLLASIAQRYAVPTVKDFAVVAASAEIMVTFDEIKVSTQETAPAYFIRSLSEVVDRYPVLAGPTQFDVGEARVVALDLEKVTADDISSEGKRQACVMYLLGREVLSGRLKVDAGDVEHFPSHTRAYHMQRVRELRETTKSLNYDEAHRISGQEQVIEQLSRDIREGPKYRVVTSLATQEIGDLNATMVNLAANKILLGVGNPAEAKKIQELVGLSDEATQMLRSIRRAGPEGSTALYLLQIDKAPGYIMLPLVLTLGPEEVWAYSTTNEDDALRQRCYEKAGVPRTLNALKTFFPETTVTTYLEQLREANTSERSIDYIEEIAEQILSGQFDRHAYLQNVRYGGNQ